jgi:hypothetical protein
MREHKLPQATIARFGCAKRRFGGRKAFMAYLKRLGITKLKVTPDPVQIATEGALRGSIMEQGLLDGTVIVSDGAGQFRIAEHALCWVHAERLIHKLDTFCDEHVKAKERIRRRIWRLYKALKDYRLAPSPRRAATRRSRCTPTARKTISAVRSRAARSPPVPARTRATTLAMLSSGS